MTSSDRPLREPFQGRSAAIALRKRLGQPVHWAVFGAMFLLQAGWGLWSLHREGSPMGPRQWGPELLGNFGFLFGVVWLSPVPLQWARTRALPARLAVALLAAEAYLLCFLLVDTYIRFGGGPYPPLLDLVGFHVVFFAPAMALIGFVQDARERLHHENGEIRAQAEEAQAKVLQGQLHPHVLFNAMNGLAELVHKNPPAAEESIRHISALLRKVLDATEQPAYTLGDERALLEDYLHMERIRLTDRLRLRWDWDTALDPLPLAPLMLQPLVENALKHGVTPSVAGGDLHILARREGAHLVLQVRNTGLPLDPQRPEGVGTRNLRARLALLYRKGDSFELRREGDWTVATLRLEQDALAYGTASLTRLD